MELYPSRKDNGDRPPCLAYCGEGAVIVPPHGLEKGLNAVIQVEEEDNHRRNIDGGNHAILEAADHHGVDIECGPRGKGGEPGRHVRHHPDGEMEEMDN